MNITWIFSPLRAESQYIHMHLQCICMDSHLHESGKSAWCHSEFELAHHSCPNFASLHLIMWK